MWLVWMDAVGFVGGSEITRATDCISCIYIFFCRGALRSLIRILYPGLIDVANLFFAPD